MPESTAQLLEAWREAERDLSAVVPGTPTFEAAARHVEACRDAYHLRLVELADDQEPAGGVSPD